jgi:hypothetical protein
MPLAMTRSTLLGGILAMLLAPMSVSSPPDLSPEGEFLVKFHAGTPPEAIQSSLAGVGAVVIKHLPTLDIYLIRMTEGQGASDAQQILQQLPGLEYVQPNRQAWPAVP